MRSQTVLQVDRRERRGQLAQIGGGRADLTGELAETPMRRGNWRIGTRQDQGKVLGIVPVRLDVDEGGFDNAGPASLGSAAHRAGQIVQREEPLVIGPREPFGRDAADAFTARDIDLITTIRIAAGIKNLHVHGKTSMTDAESLSLSPAPSRKFLPLSHSSTGRCGLSPQNGSGETLARPQGKAFPHKLNFPLNGGREMPAAFRRQTYGIASWPDRD